VFRTGDPGGDVPSKIRKPGLQNALGAKPFLPHIEKPSRYPVSAQQDATFLDIASPPIQLLGSEAKEYG
jgi:hypothetical protein